MRKYAYLKEPLKRNERDILYKVMLCEAEEGWYLFGYSRPDALLSCCDLCYDSPEELYEDWNGQIDERGWMELDDPLPDCQQDAFLPIRVKGRNIGKPEWGKFEILRNGEWTAYTPVTER